MSKRLIVANMGDLDNSPLFDQRHIKFIRELLSGHPLIPLSGIEQRFLFKKLLIKEIDLTMEGQLTQKLTEYQKFLAVQVVIEFLLIAQEEKLLTSAIQILEVTRTDAISGELKDLLAILEESKIFPAQWAAPIYGEAGKDRHDTQKQTNKSNLDLNAMQNFK